MNEKMALRKIAPQMPGNNDGQCVDDDRQMFPATRGANDEGSATSWRLVVEQNKISSSASMTAIVIIRCRRRRQRRDANGQGSDDDWSVHAKPDRFRL